MHFGSRKDLFRDSKSKLPDLSNMSNDSGVLNSEVAQKNSDDKKLPATDSASADKNDNIFRSVEKKESAP